MRNTGSQRRAPDFVLPDVNGESVSLGNLLRTGRRVLLVFLRHLGWLACAEHVAQLCHNEAELLALDTSVLLISFGAAEGTKEWLDEVCPSFPALIDAGRDVYREYQLEQSLWGSSKLKTLAYYLRSFAQGRKWRDIKGDSTQLAGDFIINPDGTFLLEYSSEDPTDRPPVADILALLREAAS